MSMLLTSTPMYYAGGGFPWGLLIVGGILFFLWKNGFFDGFGRRGNGSQYGGFGPGFGPGRSAQNQGPEYGFRGPRETFEEWHRQAHETASAQPAAPTAPAAPQTETAPPATGDSAR
jgi:hypothetical protein